MIKHDWGFEIVFLFLNAFIIILCDYCIALIENEDKSTPS